MKKNHLYYSVKDWRSCYVDREWMSNRISKCADTADRLSRQHLGGEQEVVVMTVSNRERELMAVLLY